MVILMFCIMHGQTAARDPHVAHQFIFAALGPFFSSYNPNFDEIFH